MSNLGFTSSVDTRLPVGEDIADQWSARTMRETLALWLVGLLCAVVALAFTALLLDQDSALLDQRFKLLKSLLDVLVGPIVTLLSTVLGFYFGTQAAQRANSKGSGS